MPIRLDSSRRPVFVTSGHGELEPKEFERYLDDCRREFFRDRSPYALIFNATGMTVMSATLRKRQAQWVQDHKLQIKTQCRGVAFVLPQAFHRAILTAVHWMAPPPYDFVIVGSMGEAEAWIHHQV